MSEEIKADDVVCGRCGCRPVHVDGKATWFGSYEGQKRVDVICSECWDKGERWGKDQAKP